jgi:putative ABC transport system permease protein
VDNNHWNEFLTEVKEAPRIGGMGIKEATRASFKKSTGDMIGKITTIYFTFAIIVSFGVVYNSARIALSERGRDLATLRVIGFTQREVGAVLISELVILTLAAIPFGMWIGTQLAGAIVHTASTESVRLPLVLTGHTYAMAIVVVLCSSLLSFAVVGMRLAKLDLLGVLKARE